MHYKTVDLSSCDKEQVQFSNAIQPHGVLIAVEEDSWTVCHVSMNSATLFDCPVESLIAKPLTNVLGEPLSTFVRERTKERPLDRGPQHIQEARFGPTGAILQIFAHRHDGLLILEFEPFTGERTAALTSLYDEVLFCIQELQYASSFQDFLDLAAQRIRSFGRFDRVVICKFLEDGSGEVRAESRCMDVEPYLGKRFPASDIPLPARRLYELVWLKYMPDISYGPVPIMPDINRSTGRPLDLSYAFLRSQSPMCNKYYLNMGVKGKLILSLMKEGRLWGTVACHYQQPTIVPYEKRMAAECLAHMLSMLLAAKEESEHSEYQLKLIATAEQLADQVQRADLLSALVEQETTMATCIEVDGAAVVIGKEVRLFGDTPTKEEVRVLSSWLAQQSGELLHTDRLPALYAPASSFRHQPCGLLAARLSQDGTDALFWFRREVVQTVKWAGDPRKPVEVDPHDGEQRFTPRRSFELWQEAVWGTSKPWLDAERDHARTLRQCVLAAQLVRANSDLVPHNQELESFAHIAAHELREPVRGIKYMLSFLTETAQEALSPEERRYLVTIDSIADRMEQLIQSLLRWSQVAYEERNLDVHAISILAQRAVTMLPVLIKVSATTVSIHEGMPSCRCDAVGVIEVFQNLVSNAVKYNDKPDKRVDIGFEPTTPPTFYVRDNGIGIKPEHQTKVFDMFVRLHRRDKYGGGTGAGLSIVKRIVDRHGGRVWVDSKPGEGSTFFFTLSQNSSPTN